jgi:hypothetical protein
VVVRDDGQGERLGPLEDEELAVVHGAAEAPRLAQNRVEPAVASTIQFFNSLLS